MSASTRNHWKIIGFTIFGLVAVGAITYLIIASNVRDPRGLRSCDCELLKEWAATVPFTPDGAHPDLQEISVAEEHNGFVIRDIQLEEVIIDREAITTALTEPGINKRVDVDQADEWTVSFFSGETSFHGPWSLDIVATASRVGASIRVTVDGSPWGLETIDDLWDFYRADPEAAKAAQVERQEEAIRILRSLQQALESMVEEE